ncbi:hypothetical protein ZIOFF_028140 [Zingiber officinale]|uniref:Uncharacterized protein n=1 Tax=Zingiber officinale TaxID=94328 RepID=A0A8J5LDM1_ZINOF|nr:hypothetical protein ZIOFF_028140 [Zingiber officinale]
MHDHIASLADLISFGYLLDFEEDASAPFRCSDQKTYKNSVHGVKGLSAQTSYRYFKLKNQLLSRWLTCLATFEAPSSSTECSSLDPGLLQDFLILFFTEALFYSGVAIFVMLIDVLWRPIQAKLPKKLYVLKIQRLPLTSVVTSAMPLIIPLLTMGLVWPWTGPAASAILAPYLVCVVVQFSFEQYASRKKSPALPVIPIIFHIYRLHQLNRAAQLVSALSLSVRGTEITSQTTTISNSLGVLFTVLQILGIISIWSLSSFLMRFLPPSEAVF